MPMHGRSTSLDHRELTAHLRNESFTQKAPLAGPVLQQVTIGSLPDEVLLQIFDSYQVVINNDSRNEFPWNWEKLVHVCRRWRYVIFESPLRLNLQLFCTAKTPVRKLLDIWPELPLAIDFDYRWLRSRNSEDIDNLVAALERCDRVRQIHINRPPDSLWRQISTMIQESFPALTSVQFASNNGAFFLPHTFLNGSAPCLQHLELFGISFPSMPCILLSATDLISLKLWDIPDVGYISPDDMATSLSLLTRLETLFIQFRSPTPHPKRRNRHPPPLTRSLFPVLTTMRFHGVSEYLEVLAARIDAPQLDYFEISFFNQLVFDISQIVRFIRHSEWVRLSYPSLTFDSRYACIAFSPNPYRSPLTGPVPIWQIFCEGFDWQVFSIAQICGQILPFVNVRGLDINIKTDGGLSLEFGPDDVESTVWLELFHSFASVERLEISAKLEPFIAPALQELTGESATEVFPSLNSLYIKGDISDKASQQGIQSFVTARRHSNHPIAVHRLRQ